MKPFSALLLPALLLPSCDVFRATSCPAGEITGLIRIDTAAFKTTGTTISRLYITNVMRDGKSISPMDAIRPGTGGDSRGMSLEGDKIVCDTACRFAGPGNYTFDVSAPGAITQQVKVNIPGYDAGGCGGVTTGTPVTLNLKFDAAPPTIR